MFQKDNNIYVDRDLKTLSDYIEFRNMIKSYVEEKINKSLEKSFQKPEVNIFLGKNVRFINSACLGFLLWLSGEYTDRINIIIYEEELYNSFKTTGFTLIWNVTLDKKIFDNLCNNSSYP